MDAPSSSTLPEEKSQAANDKWVEANGAQGLIKLRGEGRTIEVVRAEMELYALGMKTATIKAAAAAEAALSPLLAPLRAPSAPQAWWVGGWVGT